MNIHKSVTPVHTFSYITIKFLESLSAVLGLFRHLGAWFSVAGFFEASAVGIQALHRGLSVTQRKSQTFLILTIVQESWKILFEVT